MNTIKSIKQWFVKAVPTPTVDNKLVQIGCHFEEVSEMVSVFCSKGMYDSTNDELAEIFKLKPDYLASIVDGLDEKQKVEILDSLCDQIVTAVGVAHMLGFDIESALAEVSRSNDSKFVNGEPVFNEQGKIMKGEHYSKPELNQFIGG